MNKAIIVAILILCVAVVSGQTASSYRIGIEDRLSVSFWQADDSDLNTDVRVTEDGMITLPVIGTIKAAGLTTEELSDNIVEQMSYYNPGISQATVIVTEYNSRSVVVNGAVYTPGEIHFEKIPNLLEVIRKAGGAQPSADLAGVTIIRQTDDARAKVINVDILEYIKNGDLSAMPQLQPKDLVNVPESPYGVTGEVLTGQTFQGKNIYFIYGAVTEPGVKSLTEDIELTDAIAAAGGITEGADIRNISVAIKSVHYSSILKFDLDKYNRYGSPQRYKLKPEDTIFVPFRNDGSLISRLPEIIIPALATAIATAITTSIIVD